MYRFKNYLILQFLLFSIITYSQDENADNTPNWDNVMYAGNKVSWGSSENRRQSAEFQARFNNDLSALEQWQVEYASTFLVAKRWEIVPDFRYTKKPTRNEYRPGLGGIFKKLNKKSQLVHQAKWQYDIKEGINNSQGLRYVFFYNYLYTDEILITGFGGALFEFGKDFNGFSGLRAGINAAYIFNQAHTLNVGYFYGLVNDKSNNFTNIGVISLQLIINIRKDYKYLPAKYFNI